MKAGSALASQNSIHRANPLGCLVEPGPLAATVDDGITLMWR
jgi:hypothetical protein